MKKRSKTATLITFIIVTVFPCLSCTGTDSSSDNTVDKPASVEKQTEKAMDDSSNDETPADDTIDNYDYDVNADLTPSAEDAQDALEREYMEESQRQLANDAMIDSYNEDFYYDEPRGLPY